MTASTTTTHGPLARSGVNPRYFKDARGRHVLLVGMHTWNNMRDMGPTDPPRPLDFNLYLDVLTAQGHNFTRLWSWDMLCTWKESDHVSPFPWLRTGPGLARDGRPRFDLSRLDDSYFVRLRDRVVGAGRRGIYVNVMLFESWGVQTSSRSRRDLHLFARDNNINGIDIPGSERDGVLRAWCAMDDPKVLRLQEAYVRRVVETLNGCDNVLYEISNEAGASSHAWQEHITAFIRQVEEPLPARHPVGQTGGCGTLNRLAYASNADYIAPDCYASDGISRGYLTGAFTWGAAPFDQGTKVVILDTDHLWGVGGDPSWVWKSFCRGYNVLYMDPCTDQPWHFFDHPSFRAASDPAVRYALGKIRHDAERMELSTTVPSSSLSTTTYCLATPGREYLVYQPDSGPFSLDLEAGTWEAEWHWPDLASGQTGIVIRHEGGWRTFESKAVAALFLRRMD